MAAGREGWRRRGRLRAAREEGVARVRHDVLWRAGHVRRFATWPRRTRAAAARHRRRGEREGDGCGSRAGEGSQGREKERRGEGREMKCGTCLSLTIEGVDLSMKWR